MYMSDCKIWHPCVVRCLTSLPEHTIAPTNTCLTGTARLCNAPRREFGPRIRSWSTFNEPGVFAFSGYVFGSFPPGKFFATQVAGLVVKHMLLAHDKAYYLIKSLPGAFPDTC